MIYLTRLEEPVLAPGERYHICNCFRRKSFHLVVGKYPLVVASSTHQIEANLEVRTIFILNEILVLEVALYTKGRAQGIHARRACSSMNGICGALS